MGSRAALHVVKTGAGPGLRYGAAAYGTSSSALKSARFFTCSTLGSIQGRSTTARACLMNYDIGAHLATDPIWQWAAAAWDQLIPHDQLMATWKKAMTTVATAGRPFSKVAGPAGAYVASAHRLGWQTPSWRHILLDEDTLVDIADIAPRGLKALAFRSWQRREARHTDLAKNLGGTPDFEPLRAFISRKGLSHKVASSLRSLGEGGWWTQ